MTTGWDESDSRLFLDLAQVAVPEREAQIEAFCSLVPPAGARGGQIWELCCGEGLLTRALLERLPEARLRAFDGSPAMLEATARASSVHSGRLETRTFDLAATDWRNSELPLQAVVSSLAIHHLDGPGKQALYRDMAALLAPGGALLVADLVAPQGEAAKGLAARAWEQETRQRSLTLTGGLEAFERFQAEGWNYYADPDPDPMDKPSPLLDQLLWLREAGLEAVDVYWMKAGHALFGGYKPR